MNAFHRLVLIVMIGLGTAPALAAMRLGVNTHFEQGWPLAAFSKVAEARAQGIRDVVIWGKVETSPGVYSFTDLNSGHIAYACRHSIPVLLVIPPRNKIYGGVMAIYTETGRSAFARFVQAVADRFPCLVGIEVGNEINALSRKGKGPPPSEQPAAYVATIKGVHDALKPRYPDVALVGGSSLSVATGFLEKLFAAGMLPIVDGVAVHPYSDTPEQLPLQFQRLKDAMARHGEVKPIWSTEFGLYYKTPEAAPPHAIKVITVMSAAHVSDAYWYALLDEKWFSNMGLYAGSTAKPALDTFQLATQRLLPAGDARRIDAGDHLTYIYQFGHGPYVMWGSGRAIRFDGTVDVYDARGRKIVAPKVLGPDPIVVDAPASYELGALPVLADTLYDFGLSPWSELVQTATGKEMPMRWIDGRWTSYVGLPGADNFKAMAAVVTGGGSGVKPWSLIERYTSPIARKIWVSACFEPGQAAAAMVRITHAGHDLYAGKVNIAHQPPLVGLLLAAGESVDVSYTAAATGGPFGLRRRIRVLTSPDSSPAQSCAPATSEAAQ